MLRIAAVLLIVIGFFAFVLYLIYLAGKKAPKLKEVCFVCSVAYSPDEFINSEISKKRMCVKCKLAEKLNRREIGE